MTKPVRAIDLFCGVGGSSFGASKAGIDIVAGFDCWDIATRTYATNFPQSKVYKEDIRKLSPKEIRKEIGDIDLILASPECTNHSVAKGKKQRDEQSRMTAFEVIRFAEEFKPQWIVVENVVQMQSWSKHAEFLDSLWKLGYFVREIQLNAQDFGVPQSRNRLFLLCSLSGEARFTPPTNNSHQPAASIIDITGKYKKSLLNTPRRAKATLSRADRAVAALGETQPFLIVYYGTDGSGGWQSVGKPLRTITTLDRFAYVEPSEYGHMMRMLQPEELKLAMGFDSSFTVSLPKVPRRERIKLIGNSVCPPVMEYITRSLTNTLSRIKENSHE